MSRTRSTLVIACALALLGLTACAQLPGSPNYAKVSEKYFGAERATAQAVGAAVDGVRVGDAAGSAKPQFLNLNNLVGVYEVALGDAHSSMKVSLSCFGSKNSNCQYVTSNKIGAKPLAVSDSRWVESFPPIDMAGIRRSLAYAKSNSNQPGNPADKPILDLVRPAIAAISDVELCGDLHVGGSNATVVCRTVAHAGAVSPPLLLQFNADMGPCGPAFCGYAILPLTKKE